jgi:Phage portal protein, lambda family
MKRHSGSIDRLQLLEWVKWDAFGTKPKRRNMIHLFEKTRPRQTRGVPYLAPVIETIKQMDCYREAEIMATVVAAMLTVFIKTEESEDVAPVRCTGTSGYGRSRLLFDLLPITSRLREKVQEYRNKLAEPFCGLK